MHIYVCSLAIKMPLKVVNLVFNFKYFSVGKEQFNYNSFFK
jgi:hypothetical protein